MTAARLHAIYVKRARRGPMDARERATLVAGRGVEDSADQGGKRQVTIVSKERWDALMRQLGAALEPSARRANLVVAGLSLAETRGRVLRVGACRIRVAGETRPCERMDEAWPGLREAMRSDWGGGVYGEVIEGGTVAVGDPVAFED